MPVRLLLSLTLFAVHHGTESAAQTGAQTGAQTQPAHASPTHTAPAQKSADGAGALAAPVVDASRQSVARPPLSFDSPLPRPDIAEWARGEPPDFADPSKIYLLNFWSSAITPARESLSRLSKLSDQYRDAGLVVVGITDEPAGAIRHLLDSPKFTELVRFPIGCDPDRSTYHQFMSQSWQVSLPTAFLAQAGKIVWIGNPRDVADVLALVTTEKWSPEGRREAFEENARAIKRAIEFEQRLDNMVDRRDWDAMLGILTEMEQDPSTSIAREGQLMRVGVLQQAGRTVDAIQFCDTLVQTTNDWQVAAEVARMLASPLFAKAETSRATIAALKAIGLSKQKEAIPYCALAEVQARAGQSDLALRSLERALALAMPEEADAIYERMQQLKPPAAPATRAP